MIISTVFIGELQERFMHIQSQISKWPEWKRSYGSIDIVTERRCSNASDKNRRSISTIRKKYYSQSCPIRRSIVKPVRTTDPGFVDLTNAGFKR